MNPQDDDKLSRLLKASPSLVPPESFYRGVLEKIERKRAPVPWYFGYPMKALTTACVLMLIVLVAREKKPVVMPPASLATSVICANRKKSRAW